MKETNKLKLIVGDWSKDGHNQSDDFYIESNLSMKEIQTAYNEGTKKLGFNLSETVALESWDPLLPKKNWDILVSLGYRTEGMEDMSETEAETGICLYPEFFSDIYLFIVKLGDPRFEYKMVESEDEIHIGGYGLYHS